MAADGTVGPNLDLVGGAAGLADALVAARKQDDGRGRVQTHHAFRFGQERVVFSLSSGVLDTGLPLDMPFKV